MLQRQAARHDPLLLPTEDRVNVIGVGNRPVHVARIARYLRKARIVDRHKCGQGGVADLDRADPLQSELFHQPVLQCLVRPLYPPLGLRRVRTQDVDV
jgi:hypothetical protein